MLFTAAETVLQSLQEESKVRKKNNLAILKGKHSREKPSCENALPRSKMLQALTLQHPFSCVSHSHPLPELLDMANRLPLN